MEGWFFHSNCSGTGSRIQGRVPTNRLLEKFFSVANYLSEMEGLQRRNGEALDPTYTRQLHMGKNILY